MLINSSKYLGFFYFYILKECETKHLKQIVAIDNRNRRRYKCRDILSLDVTCLKYLIHLVLPCLSRALPTYSTPILCVGLCIETSMSPIRLDDNTTTPQLQNIINIIFPTLKVVRKVLSEQNCKRIWLHGYIYQFLFIYRYR